MVLKRSDSDTNPVTVTLPYTLCGIKDKNGEFTARDKIVLENGRVKLIEEIKRVIVDGINYKTGDKILTAYGARFNIWGMSAKKINYGVISDKFVSSEWIYDSSKTELEYAIMTNPTAKLISFAVADTELISKTNSEFNEWLNANPISCDYAIEEPVETDITETEAGRLILQLNTYFPETYIECDTDIKIKYAADTTAVYNKLKQAIIALGGTV